VIDKSAIDPLWKEAGWRGALTILLGSTSLCQDSRVWKHIDLFQRRIYFERILADATFTPSERALLEIAASLFSGEVRISLGDVFLKLDDQAVDLAMTAIRNFTQPQGSESPFTRPRKRAHQRNKQKGGNGDAIESA